jgi:3-phenylpropionate/trans-cinnamate dioxygenase ferredoxin subunit
MMADKLRLAAVDDFEPGEVKRCQVGDEAVAVVRIDDNFYALGDRCSHANYSLSEGEVDCEELTLTCWKHGAEFSLSNGVPQTLPATQPVPVFEVQVSAGEVFVTLPGEDA